MTSEDRTSDRIQAATGRLRKLFGRGRDQHYQSWIVASKPKATEPAGKDNTSIKR